MIYSIHGTKYWKNIYQKILFKSLWFLSSYKNTIFIANSEYSKKVFIDNIFDNADIEVVHNPIDSKFVYHRKNYRECKKIIYIGRLSEGKNLTKWLEIAEEIHKVNKIITFEIYGSGPLQNQLELQIKNKNLNYIKLNGTTHNPEIIYANSDLLLFLSNYESFGNVVIESILCGTPVIVSKIPSMMEIFADFPQFMVPLGDNLLKDIIYKLDDYNHLLDLTQNAYKDFKVKYSEKNHIDEIRKIYSYFEQ